MNFKKLNELRGIKLICNDEINLIKNEISGLGYLINNRSKMPIRIPDETFVGIIESLELKRLELEQKNSEMAMILYQMYLVRSDKL